MARDLELRNQMIYEAHCSGKSIQDLSEMYGVTRQRISQIIGNYQPPMTDDEARAHERARFDYMENILLTTISEGPHDMVDVKGNVVIDSHGIPIKDHSQVHEAIDIYRKISAEKRRMEALDKPRRKQLVEDEAMKQAQAWLSQLDRVVVHAEVDDPSASSQPQIE